MSVKRKSHRASFEIEPQRAYAHACGTPAPPTANTAAAPADKTNHASHSKDAASSIHESRIRAASHRAAGTAADLPDPAPGNPIYALAKSLVMKDSSEPHDQSQSARSRPRPTRARSARA
jgi:hypothetical protein